MACPDCDSSPETGSLLVLEVSMNRLPYLMCIMLNRDAFQINDRLSYLHDQFDVIFQLRGIIYGDGNHFVARLFISCGKIWFHDGMTTQSKCTFEGNLDQIPDNDWLMTSSKGYSCRKAILAIYARD